MLNQIKKLYVNEKTFCNLNMQSISPSNFCLHVHILNREQYKSTFSNYEQGTRVKSMLDVNLAFNNLKLR
jgi:hypothetical protein